MPVQMHACKSSFPSVNALLAGKVIKSAGNVFDLTEKQLSLEFLSSGWNQSQLHLSGEEHDIAWGTQYCDRRGYWQTHIMDRSKLDHSISLLH